MCVQEHAEYIVQLDIEFSWLTVNWYGKEQQRMWVWIPLCATQSTRISLANSYVSCKYLTSGIILLYDECV